MLLTEGHDGAWVFPGPDNSAFGVFAGNPTRIGYGGWEGPAQQVATISVDNEFTDFEEPMAETVIGWKGITVAPNWTIGDLDLSGEYSRIDYNTNWQAWGDTSRGITDSIYPNFESDAGVGSFRNAYAPFQDKKTDIAILRGKYLLNVGKGVDVFGKIKYIDETDKRMNDARFLPYQPGDCPGGGVACHNNAHNYSPGHSTADLYGNPPVITVNGVTGYQWKPFDSLSDDDRDLNYKLFQLGAGYQVTGNLYSSLTYERYNVDLKDGNTAFQAYQLHSMASGTERQEQADPLRALHLRRGRVRRQLRVQLGHLRPRLRRRLRDPVRRRRDRPRLRRAGGLPRLQGPLRRLEQPGQAGLQAEPPEGVHEGPVLAGYTVQGRPRGAARLPFLRIRTVSGDIMRFSRSHLLTATLLASLLAPPAFGAGKELFTLTDPRGDDHGDGKLVYPLQRRSEARRSRHPLPHRPPRTATARCSRSPSRAPCATPGPGGHRRPRHPARQDGPLRLLQPEPRHLHRHRPGPRLRRPHHAPRPPRRDRSVDRLGEGGHPDPPAQRGARPSSSGCSCKTLNEDTKKRPAASPTRRSRRSRSRSRSTSTSGSSSRPRSTCAARRSASSCPASSSAARPRPPGPTSWPPPAPTCCSRFDLARKLGRDPSDKSLMILPISPGRWQDRFGGGRENADIQPPLVDLIVAKGGRTQEQVLADFDARAKRPVKLTGVVPADQK